MISKVIPTSSHFKINCMKKRCLPILILLCVLKAAISQNPYYDAMALQKLLHPTTSRWPDENAVKVTVKDILAHYCPRNDIAKNFLTDNPFISDYAADWASKSGAGSVGSKIEPVSIISSAGGINVTNLADGLAKFLIERAKQELSISFFRKFKEDLEDKKYRHLTTLFHNTADLLRTIDKDIYKFSTYIQSLRDAFIKDLNNLFDTAPKAIEDGLLDGVFSEKTLLHLKPVLLYALQLTKGIKNGNHPGMIIENFKLVPDQGSPRLIDMNAILSITKLFSTSFESVDKTSDKYWLSADSIRLLLADSNAMNMYLGILYEQGKNIKLSNGLTFQKLLSAAVNNFTAYKELINDYIGKFTDVHDALAELKGKKKSEITYTEYYDLFESALNLFKTDENIAALPGIVAGFSEQIETFLYLADNANDLFLDISLKKYSSGVMRLVAICDTVLQPAYDNFAIQPGAKEKLETYKNFRAKLIKYGTFLASMAEAQNSDEIKAAIEAAVLPVGSASIKRESYFNISLNAFIGPYAGVEYLPRLKEKQWAPVAGVTAPVGVAFSWGKIKKNKELHDNDRKRTIGNKSVSIFIPLIDVGSMASFRLGNDSSKVASKVTLSNIISPGLYVYYGFGKCPISIGIGGQVGPQLREVTALSNNVDKNFYVRFGLNIVVDIPFFNFYIKE